MLLCIFAGPRNQAPVMLRNAETGELISTAALGLDRKGLYRDSGDCRSLILTEFQAALEERGEPPIAATATTPVWVSPTLLARFGPSFGIADFPADRSWGNGCWSGRVEVRGKIEYMSTCVLSDAGAFMAQANPAMLERLRQIFED